MGMISHHLNRTLDVFRETHADDGAGGTTVTYTPIGPVAAKVDLPSSDEQVVAAQSGSQHTHNIFFEPDADVQRNDHLIGDGQTFRVMAIVQPSQPRYSKARVELIQPGPGIPLPVTDSSSSSS